MKPMECLQMTSEHMEQPTDSDCSFLHGADVHRTVAAGVSVLPIGWLS